MAVIKCKMCGGDMELSADQTLGTCEYCGSTMTLPRIDDQQRAAAFDRGNHFRRLGEFDKALSVYERIVQEDENDAEAHWCCALCRFGIEYVKDPASREYLPTCHRASFDSFLEDVDYQAALAHADPIARRQYEKDGERIAAVQRGILSTVQKEEPFDVFICYKESDEAGQRTVDSTLAQDIYYQLTEQGRRVFFARITLEDKAGQEYEPYIFAALHSARVMVVVGTRPEYLSAVWVKNEWSRYLALMKSDRKRLLIPCYRDMDPYDLPEQLSVLQSYDMGKIGFIQDLIRGIAKVLDADKKPVKETVIVQGEGGGPSVESLLKRGRIFLEDGDWAKADEYFDKVLDMDPENGDAYAGKLCAEMHYHRLSDIAGDTDRWGGRKSAASGNYDKILRYGSEALKTEIEGYIAQARERCRADKYKSACNAMERAGSHKEYEQVAVQFERMGDYRDAAEKAQECRRLSEQKKAEEEAEAAQERERKKALAAQRQENNYAAACAAMEQAVYIEDYQEAEKMFRASDLRNYKDSAQRAKECGEEVQRLKNMRRLAEEKEAERKRQEAEEEAKRRQEEEAEAKRRQEEEALRIQAENRRKTRRTLITIAAAVVVAIAVFFVQRNLRRASLERTLLEILPGTTTKGSFGSNLKLNYMDRYYDYNGEKIVPYSLVGKTVVNEDQTVTWTGKYNMKTSSYASDDYTSETSATYSYTFTYGSGFYGLYNTAPKLLLSNGDTIYIVYKLPNGDTSGSPGNPVEIDHLDDN